MENAPQQLKKSEQKNFLTKPVNVADIKFKGNPESLKNFPQWVWYTVASPVLWGNLTESVLSAVQQDTGLTYHRKVFDKPIFSGFGSAWDHTLWAVPQTEWPLLREELLSITQVDVEKKLLVKYGLQELSVYDPLAVDKFTVIPPDVPIFSIYAFGVMSNKKTIAFNPAQKVVERPRVYTFKAEERIISLSDKTLSGMTDLDDVASRMEEL